MPSKLAGAILLATIATGPASAPAETPACVAADTAFPTGFERWATAAPLQRHELREGKPVRLTLVAEPAFVIAPAKPPTPGTFGGVFPFRIRTRGTYDIALSEAAWIDVVDRGSAMTSTAHRRGPPCTGIHKIVTFALPPGTYRLQISGSANHSTTAAIARHP